MATYVMSDLHGMFDEFIEMLDLIRFSSEDNLIIIGDIFDRGPNPIEIIDFIAGRKNIHLIRGNHEEMFLEYCENGYPNLWYMNGGRTTHEQIMEKGFDYQESLYKYIKNLPTVMVWDDNILCHAGLYLPSNYNEISIEKLIDMQDEETVLWDRSNIGNERKIEGFNIICGHTPVQTIDKNDDESSEVKILERNGTYYIDCGCYFKNHGGKLACLRLEDKKEYYV